MGRMGVVVCVMGLVLLGMAVEEDDEVVIVEDMEMGEREHIPRSTHQSQTPSGSGSQRSRKKPPRGSDQDAKPTTTPEDCFESVQKMAERASEVVQKAIKDGNGWVDGEKLEGIYSTTEKAVGALKFGTHYHAATRGSAQSPTLRAAALAAQKARDEFKQSVEAHVEKHRHLMRATHTWLQPAPWEGSSPEPKRLVSLRRYTKRRLNAGALAGIQKRSSSAGNIKEMLEVQKAREKLVILPFSPYEVIRYGSAAGVTALFLWLPFQILRVINRSPVGPKLVRPAACFSAIGLVGYMIVNEVGTYLSVTSAAKTIGVGLWLLWIMNYFLRTADKFVTKIRSKYLKLKGK
eukprot:Hpha_TRINITY_DN36322_c0_g1::TRINITY_DN36322_c0_g1_i1::g.86392::m.86392